jgi:zinc transport system substrate-binding protein
LLIQARHIARKLTELDPSDADLFAERLAILAGSLEELDARIALELAPHRGRTFVVFHPSWGYFADDYGLRQIAIEVDGKDPSDTELSRFQESTRDLGITVVFVQPQISGRSARAVAAAIGARIETLDPLAANVLANLSDTADKIADSLHE